MKNGRKAAGLLPEEGLPGKLIYYKGFFVRKKLCICEASPYEKSFASAGFGGGGLSRRGGKLEANWFHHHNCRRPSYWPGRSADKGT